MQPMVPRDLIANQLSAFDPPYDPTRELRKEIAHLKGIIAGQEAAHARELAQRETTHANELSKIRRECALMINQTATAVGERVAARVEAQLVEMRATMVAPPIKAEVDNKPWNAKIVERLSALTNWQIVIVAASMAVASLGAAMLVKTLLK